VQFDNEAMLATCIKALAEAPPIAKTRLKWRKADIAIGRSGVDATEKSAAAPVTLDESDIELPDILTDLQDKTALTRRSIYRIRWPTSTAGHRPVEAALGEPEDFRVCECPGQGARRTAHGPQE